MKGCRVDGQTCYRLIYGVGMTLPTKCENCRGCAYLQK